MIFVQNHLYHIYNQGNNREKIYFSWKDYQLFTRKIKEHIFPYADILAWCLMPNHFHLMVYVNSIELPDPDKKNTHPNSRTYSLNDSIGILLRSYTGIVNKEQERSGSLFRQRTKAVCLDPDNGLLPTWYTINGSAQSFNRRPEEHYPQICFNYIHFNPVVSGLAKDISAWEYSSAPELLGMVNENLVNKQRVNELDLKMSP